MKMKKIIALMATVTMTIVMAAGCGNTTGKTEGTSFDTANEISIISREDGSGTRGAFVELFEIEQKNEAGEKVDYTTE